jgi:hypothetical protein
VLTGRRPQDRHTAPPRQRAHTATRARRRLAVLAAAVPVGLLASVTLVWNSSHAAFVATTGTPGNAWETGAVQLSSDHSATALFTTASEGLLVPGSSGDKCITVTYSGNVDTADTGVRLYGALTTDSAELAAALQVTVQMSTTALTPTPGADCLPAFQASPVGYATRAFSAFPTSYGTGIGDANGDSLGDWRPSASADRTRTYKISYRLPAGSYPSTVQGKKVAMTFTWEVQSDTPGA